MAWANTSKNSATFTNQAFSGADMTWDEATFTWDDATDQTWDKPYAPMTNQSKNSASFININKS